MKRLTALLLLFTLFFNTVSPFSISAVEENVDRFIDYNDKPGINAFVAIMDVPKVSTGTAYHTVGLKATARYQDEVGTMHTFTVYQPLTDQEVIKNYVGSDGRDWVITQFKITRESLFTNFKSIYPSTSDVWLLAQFFADKESVMVLDALVTTSINGSEQGSVTKVGGDLHSVKSGIVVEDFASFKTLASWSQTTKENMQKQYFNQGVKFEPILLEDPIAKITDVSGVQKSTFNFKLGQAYSVYGTYSEFVGIRHKFEWEVYQGGVKLKTVNNAGGTPFNGQEAVGTYTVKLRVADEIKLWDDSYKQRWSPWTSATVVIEPNELSLIQVGITAPSELMLSSGQSNIDIPVTLNTTIQNVKIEDVQSVTLKIETSDGVTTKTQYFGSSLTQSFSTTINVPYYGSPRVQAFNGSAIATLKGGGMIESPIAKAYTYLYKADSNLPPVPIINAPFESTVGSVFISGSKSYDLDGYITNYDFYVSGIGFSQDENRSSAVPTFNTIGTFQIIMGVTDDDGARSETGQYIKITPPPPSIQLTSRGYYKENRKITLIASNMSEPLSPIGQNYHWTITPMTSGVAQSNVKMVSSSGSQIDVLMKLKGRYLVTCTGTNGYNLSDTETMILDVVEDTPPFPNISANTPQFRDETKTANITAIDSSFSDDGDFIGKRVWTYKFDSDNDGSFADETSVNIKTSTNYVDDTLEFDVTSVGKYEITMTVTETFGQDTIASFITSADYKMASMSKVIEVDNYAPSVAFFAVNEKKIDLKIITDYEGNDLLGLQNKLNNFVNDGHDKYLNINYEIISDKKYVGRYLHSEAEGYSNVMDQDTPKYSVANWNGLIEYSDNSYTVTQSTTRLYTDMTETTNGTFPSRIKASYIFNGNQGRFFLLENGDVYMIGTMSGNNIGYYGSSNIWAMAPRKILSDIKQIEGGDNRYFFLSNTGKVYAFGRTVQTFEQNGSYFTAVYNRCDLSKTLPVIQDPCGGNPYSGGMTYDSIIGTGLFSPVQLTQFSSVDYIWSNGTAFVARKTDGSWKGFGQGLNGFGYPTGYVNTPPASLGSTSYKSISLSSAMTYYYDNQNTVVNIPNLTNLDQAIGGIAKIEPNKAYAKNGDIYEFKETPNALFGKEYFANKDDIPNDGRTYSIEYQYTYYDYTLKKYITTMTVFYPVQVISSQFTYIKTGNWPSLANDRAITYQYFSPVTINSSGVSGVPYLDYATVQPKVMYQSRFETAPAISPKTDYFWIDPINSIVFDYKLVAYVTNYTYSNRVYNPRILWWEDDEEGDRYGPGYDYYYTPSYGSKVLVKESQYLAGWKTYGVDVSKLNTATAFRTGSNKYVLYIGKNDAFKKVSKDLLEYVKSNGASVRVVSPTAYVDDYSINADTEIDLRRFMNATPTGKLYDENGFEQMIADIEAENSVPVAPDGGTYAIVGEDVLTFSLSFRDIEGDPQLSTSSVATHKKDYFKNSTGLSIYNNVTRGTPLKTFDKVGKYDISYKASDKPSSNLKFAAYNKYSENAYTTVYAHRRPIADFEMLFDYQNDMIGISVEDKSYDLDHQGEINGEIKNGIVKRVWAYKYEGQSEWQMGIPEKLSYGVDLEMALEVTDLEGARSKVQKHFEIPDDIPLVLTSDLTCERSEFDCSAIPASETLVLKNITVSQNLSHGIRVLIKSLDKSLEETHLEFSNSDVTKFQVQGGKRLWHDIVIDIPSDYQDGGYKVDVSLTNIKSSEGSVYVLTGTDKVLNQHDFTVKTPVKISGLINAKSGNEYDLSAVTGRYSSETNVKLFYGTLYEKTINLPITQATILANHLLDEKTWFRNVLENGQVPAGDYRAHFETQTPSGNKAIFELTYAFQPVTVKYFDARGYWNHWRGQTTLKGDVTTIEPHRFLSHECVIFEALIKGEIEGALLRLSPELEAMTFVDANNNIYRYEDDFDTKVYFPVHLEKKSTAEDGDLWQFEYALPYASSTKSLEDVRLKPPYKAMLYVFPKGTILGNYGDERVIKLEIDDIDITGNIYDLLFIEPIRGN